MAGSKKNSVIEGTVGVVVVLALVYVGYKLLFGKKVQAATSTGGYVGGGYGGYSSSPYSPYTTASTTSGIGSLLNSLLKAMGGQGSKSAGGASSGGAGSPAAGAQQTQAQLQQEMQQIAGYSSTANNLPNFADLGGYSLANLPSGYDASGVDLSGDYISSVPLQNFDFGTNSYAPAPDLGGDQAWGGPIDSIDTGDYTDLGYIGD